MSALGGATAQEEGLGATMPHQSSLCPHSSWRFFPPPRAYEPPLPGQGPEGAGKVTIQ